MKQLAIVSLFVFLIGCGSEEIKPDPNPEPEQLTLTLQPNEADGMDALLHGLASQADVNRGTNGQLPSEAWTFSGEPGVIRSVIKFDLSSIPTDASLETAYLSLYAWNSDVGLGSHSPLSGSNSSFLQKVTSAWVESTVTWNTQPTTTELNQVTLAQTTSAADDYLSIDVTALVSDMVSSPETNFGFMLKLQNENYYRMMNFCSSDHPDPARRPKLVVKYTVH